MKLDSPIFDSIRVRPDQDRRLRATLPTCEWPGCANAATHRAPKGRLHERQYWRFCLEHVREYNQSYDYFAGMSEEAVARYQKEALTGHLPTWKLGTLGGRRPQKPQFHRFHHSSGTAHDPFEFYRHFDGAGPRAQHSHAEGPNRTVGNAERRALEILGLEVGAKRGDIKARFKELVKRHHPDANGGDRSCEGKLREIIAAYNYLKSTGLC